MQTPEKIIWTTRNGRRLTLGEMTSTHLANAAKMLRRKAQEEDDNYWSFGAGLQGDMALYYWEQAGDELMEKVRYRLAVADMMDLVRNKRTS